MTTETPEDQAETQCVILAGGLGTRMWPETASIPKTLLEVAGRPFAWWQLSWLAAAGISSVVYCIGHLGEQVTEYVGDGADWNLHVSYVAETNGLLGTAGALRLAAHQQQLAGDFLVLYGDSWLPINPLQVLQAGRAQAAPALMTVFDNRGRWDRSNVEYRDGKVRRYEKNLDAPPAEMHWIDYGLLWLRREVINSAIRLDTVADLAPLLSELARSGDLAGYVADARFYEIGSPAGREELEQLLNSSHPPG